MRHPDISSKEAYLTWVQEWKVAYKALSDEIRASKVTFRRSVKLYQQGAINWGEHFEHTNTLYRQKAEATQMLAQRKEGKEESWKQKLKALAQIA